MFFVFLASGLFLGWSLGANDAANVFGTAVGSRMLRFRSAAIVCSIFVLIGAVFGGAGASHTLGKLGAVNALPGSFTVALAAALTVFWMTKAKLPVSTSQAVVGAILGWNFFSNSLTDIASLTKIVSSWILCPILAGIFAVFLLKLAQQILNVSRFHLFKIDSGTRMGLLLVGAFASYSLGANNIANVMGVFVPASPLADLHFSGWLTLSSAQQLFFLGAIAIGIGVITYSKKVMMTVGNDLFKLNPIAALIVVLAQAMVLFIFSSEGLENWLASHGLPTFPLVPVSSSQAVIGAVVGIGLAKGGRNIRFRVLGRIASGWISTPIIAAVVSFVCLFVLQNVFSQKVYSPVRYVMSHELAVKLRDTNHYDDQLEHLLEKKFDEAISFQKAISRQIGPGQLATKIINMSRIHPMHVDIEKLKGYFDYSWYSEEELHAVFRLHGRKYLHVWQLKDDLSAISDYWRFKQKNKRNKIHNKLLQAKLHHLEQVFSIQPTNGK